LGFSAGYLLLVAQGDYRLDPFEGIWPFFPGMRLRIVFPGADSFGAFLFAFFLPKISPKAPNHRVPREQVGVIGLSFSPRLISDFPPSWEGGILFDHIPYAEDFFLDPFPLERKADAISSLFFPGGQGAEFVTGPSFSYPRGPFCMTAGYQWQAVPFFPAQDGKETSVRPSFSFCWKLALSR